MPRNSSGTYNLPNGTIVSSGDTVLISQHNPAMTDIAEALTGSLPRNGAGGMLAPLEMSGFPVRNVGPGVSPTDVATVSQISSAPIGAVLDFAGSTPPSGWLLCGGQSLSRTTYAALFAVIGTAYGSVDGTTFNLPDCRGRVSAGRDFATPGLAGRLTTTTMTPGPSDLGAAGGAQTHTLTEAQMPSHTHAVSGSTNEAGAHSHSVDSASGTTFVGNGFDEPVSYSTIANTSIAGAHTHTITVSAAAAGGGGAHPNVQPTIILNKIIHTGNE